jgi:Nucleotidyl transferase AbiEii toxin, Type IV TA system
VTSPLLEAAAALLTFLDGHRIPACLIGGIVVSRWGEPRVTQDVDVAVLAELGDESRIIDVLLSRYRARLADAREFAAANRVLLLEAESHVHIDASLAAFPFEREVIDRASAWQIAPNTRLRTCSAEDLILYKLVAARPIDVHDVQMIVGRQAATLDAERVRSWGRQFAELLGRPDLLQPFETAISHPGRRG